MNCLKFVCTGFGFLFNQIANKSRLCWNFGRVNKTSKVWSNHGRRSHYFHNKLVCVRCNNTKWRHNTRSRRHSGQSTALFILVESLRVAVSHQTGEQNIIVVVCIHQYATKHTAADFRQVSVWVFRDVQILPIRECNLLKCNKT